MIHDVFYHKTFALTTARLNGGTNESFKEIMSYLSPSVTAFQCRYVVDWRRSFWTIALARIGLRLYQTYFFFSFSNKQPMKAQPGALVSYIKLCLSVADPESGGAACFFTSCRPLLYGQDTVWHCVLASQGLIDTFCEAITASPQVQF